MKIIYLIIILGLSQLSNISLSQTYDKVFKEVKGYRMVKKSGKVGFINKNNKLIIPLDYDGALNFNEKHRLFGVLKNNKAGFVNEKNEQVIPLKYDWISDISYNDYFMAKLNKKYGFISPSNKVIVPVKYDKLDWYDEDLDVTIGKLNGKSGILDGNGKEVLPFVYDNIEKKYTYNSETKKATYFFVIQKGDKYAVYDRKKGVITGFDYIFITDAKPDQSKKESDIVGFKSQYDVGAIDGKGNFTKVKYDATSIRLAYDKEMTKRNKQVKQQADKDKAKQQEALASAKYTKFQKDGKWGFKNSEGKVVVEPIYQEVTDFKSKKDNKLLSYAKCKRTGKYGLIDKTGKEILAFDYDRVSEPIDGISIVLKDNKYGYVYIGGSKTKFLTEIRYSKAEPFDANTDLAKVTLNHNIGLINKKGNEVIPAIFDNIGEFDKYGYAVVMLKEFDNSIQRTIYGILHKSGDQSKGIKLVLGTTTTYGSSKYLFNIKESGKSGSVIMHGGDKLASKAKFSSSGKSFAEMVSHRGNFIIVYNNTNETRYAHIKNYENNNTFSNHKLKPNEIMFFECISWRDIYVSEYGDQLKTKKAVDTDYASSCGTIVKMTDYYPELKNTSYYNGGY